MSQIIYERIKSHAEDMKPLEAVDYLLGVLAQVLGPSDHGLPWEPLTALGTGMSKLEKAILWHLIENEGRVVSHEAVDATHDAFYEPHLWPDASRAKIMSRLRKRIAHLPCRIKAVHGEGYMLTRTKGATLPWDNAKGPTT